MVDPVLPGGAADHALKLSTGRTRRSGSHASLLVRNHGYRMKISRYLHARDFRDEASKLKVVRGYLSDSVLERLEQQRSLLPRLRLHYPDDVERRWWAQAHPECEVCGELEADGPRWEAACALEAARQRSRCPIDPATVLHPLDAPEERFLQFIEKPADLPFVPWKDYRVSVNDKEDEPLYTYDTAIVYYSSWQLLQLAEVVNMGVSTFMNFFRSEGWPPRSEIAAAPSSISFLPMHAMHGFEQHARALDAIVRFSEEQPPDICSPLARSIADAWRARKNTPRSAERACGLLARHRDGIKLAPTSFAPLCAFCANNGRIGLTRAAR